MFMRGSAHHSRRATGGKKGLPVERMTKTAGQGSGGEGAVVVGVEASESVDLFAGVAHCISKRIEALARDGNRVAVVSHLPHPLAPAATHGHELYLHGPFLLSRRLRGALRGGGSARGVPVPTRLRRPPSGGRPP